MLSFIEPTEMRKPPLLLLALCLFVSPLFAQKDFTAWKSIDCYPGLEYSQKRSTGNGNKESHELSIKFRHHYEKAIAFSYSIKDSGGKNTLGSGNMSLDAGEDKIIQFNLSDSENLRVIITNFRLGGEGGDLIPCGSDSGDSEKKKDGDDKSDDDDKKEKKKESEVPAIVPAGGVAATTLIVGAGDKNEDSRKEGQGKESEDKKSGDQEDKNSQQEMSEKKTESGDQTEVREKEKEKETEVGKHEEQGKEGERKEGEGKEGLGKEGEKTGNEGAVKEKEAEVGELKEGEPKEGENKGGEKKEGEEKEHGEEKEEKQVTSPVTPTVETEIKNVQQTQPVTENKEPEKINEVTNPPAEEKKEQPVEKTEEKSKAEETPVVVPTSNEQKTQEQEPVKTEEQPKPIELTPKPEPTVTPTETPVKETKTEASAPITEPKTKEDPEPVVEEKEVKEEETSEGEAVKEGEEEKTLPEEEKAEESGEAKEGEGAGETGKEEEEANDDLNRRIEEGKQRQQEADDSRDQMASQLGDILSAEGGTDTYTRLAIGMNLEGGFAVQAVPMVENASSTTGAITPYSASTLPINLGIYARPELWLLRNQYFGLGVDYRVILTYSVLAGGGISSTALASGGNVRFQAGLKHFKLHFQAGKENRNGTYSNDHDVTNTALGSGTNNNIFSDGGYDYQVSNTGFGALIDFKDNNDKEAFIKYTLSYERPDFLPAANAAIKTHTIHVRYFLDIIFTYGNKYPIAGKPLYTYLASDKNKDYFFFGLGKTFKIFKSK